MEQDYPCANEVGFVNVHEVQLIKISEQKQMLLLFVHCSQSLLPWVLVSKLFIKSSLISFEIVLFELLFDAFVLCLVTLFA